MAPVPAIDVIRLRQRLQAEPGLFLLAVREPCESQQGHVPGAQRILLGIWSDASTKCRAIGRYWPAAIAGSGAWPPQGTCSNSATARSRTPTAGPPPGSGART